jgi:DNA-binding XRE family transcriptional regulator
MNSNPFWDYSTIELEGTRYVILKESLFERLCQRAGVARPEPKESAANLAPGFDIDRTSLAEKIRVRRRAAGLSQAELARRAGVRTETLNRIERGHTEPDFATIRKLVTAMNAVENAQAEKQLPKTRGK